MTMRRKKKKGDKAPDSSGASGAFGYRPFAGVDLGEVPDEVSDEEIRAAEPDCKASDPQQQEEEGDGNVLAEMMDGVEPLKGGPKLAPRRVQPWNGPAPADDAELVMRHLDDLVHGTAPFEMADIDEYIEAAVKGLDRRIVKKLRKGEFSIQAHLDLHGFRREEARQMVAEFISKSHVEGKRCVLIVHGRGLGSRDNIPVLKEKLTSWLTRGAIGKHVLAFTSARQWDGGVGAVYVLLRG
jgi:DNA-nicking Smr family endonuclease